MCAAAVSIAYACSAAPPASTPVGASSDASQSGAAPEPLSTDIDIGGYSLHIECSGSGSPTVVFISGFGDDHTIWYQQEPKVAVETRECAYDRAGLGQSEPGPGNTFTSADAARDLSGLLDGAGIGGPLVLVGHSFGGEVALEFAAMHPELVGGVVLVDSPSEATWHGPFGEWLAKQDLGTEGGRRPETSDDEAAVQSPGALGSKPLVVLTHGEIQFPARLEPLWLRFQAGLAKTSSDAVHVIATSAGHYIHTEQPALVVEAIRQVVAAVQSGSSLSPCGEAFIDLGGQCVTSSA